MKDEGRTLEASEIERKRAEEKVRQTVAELERCNADLARFNRLAVGREKRMIEMISRFWRNSRRKRR